MSARDALWKPLPWDTAFFGVNVARILLSRLQQDTLDRIVNECRAAGTDVLYFLADSDDPTTVLLAEQVGFHLVDVRMTLEWTPKDLLSSSIHDDLTLRAYRVDDLAQLQDIASTAYTDTRYYYDKHFSRERCHALYVEWITRNCQDEAVHVLVAEQGNSVVGYVTCDCTLDDQIGQIGLVGIRDNARGLGIGSALVRTAQHWFREQGMRQVLVVTQGRNIGAQRLYQRCGFVTSKVQLWYHIWLNESTVT